VTAARVLYRLSGLISQAAAGVWRAAEAVEHEPAAAAAGAAWGAILAFRLVDALAPRR
jgi:hypothetical protein